MQITRKKSKKPLLITSSIVVIVLAASVAAYYLLRPQVSVSTPTSTTSSQEAAGTINEPATEPEATTDDSTTDTDVKKDDPSTESGSASSADTPATSKKITVTITRLKQDKAGQPVQAFTLVNGTTTGTCTYTFTKAGANQVVKYFPVTFAGTTSNCNGSVNANQFSQSGEWTLHITAQDNTATSAEVTSVITVTK